MEGVAQSLLGISVVEGPHELRVDPHLSELPECTFQVALWLSAGWVAEPVSVPPDPRK